MKGNYSLYYSVLFLFIILICIFLDQLIYNCLLLDSIFINYYNESLLCYYFSYSLHYSLLFFILFFFILFFLFYFIFYFNSFSFNILIRTLFNSFSFLFFIPLFQNYFLFFNSYFFKGYINLIEIINGINCSLLGIIIL